MDVGLKGTRCLRPNRVTSGHFDIRRINGSKVGLENCLGKLGEEVGLSVDTQLLAKLWIAEALVATLVWNGIRLVTPTRRD
jgi:hypothetical protein